MIEDWKKCAICGAVKSPAELVNPPLSFRAIWEPQETSHASSEFCCRDHRIELITEGGRVYGPIEAQAAPRLLSDGG